MQLRVPTSCKKIHTSKTQTEIFCSTGVGSLQALAVDSTELILKSFYTHKGALGFWVQQIILMCNTCGTQAHQQEQ
ncbi:uncharacterized protein AB9X84_021528 isoform 2-T2 [Acanthopagrus schlegelii]